MGDHNSCNAQLLLQRLYFMAQVYADFGVKRRERFIKQQQPRAGGDGARQSDTLLLSARQLRGIFLGLLNQADQLQQFQHPGVNIWFAAPGVLQSESNILLDGQIRKQRIGLKDNAIVSFRGWEI